MCVDDAGAGGGVVGVVWGLEIRFFLWGFLGLLGLGVSWNCFGNANLFWVWFSTNYFQCVADAFVCH